MTQSGNPNPLSVGRRVDEIYLVLDPRAYALHAYARRAQLLVLPDLRNLRHFELYNLEPGNLCYIPAGTARRGIDVFVNVITQPGFKPHNEYYLDRDISETVGGAVPFNEDLLHLKNYESLDSLLSS